MQYFKPKKITIEREAASDRITQRVLQLLPECAVEWVVDSDALIRSFPPGPEGISTGKQRLLLKRKQGAFLKPFPPTPPYLDCRFQILHLGSGCDLDCTYCILQTYLNNPLLTVFTNLPDALSELERELARNPSHLFRIGTGELIDSLSLDHLTEWSLALVPFFAGKSNAILEFKTKSDNVGNLSQVDPKGRVIVSWSFNSEKIQREEELKCATLGERLAAARRCASWGYRLGFHFDPMIFYEGWEAGYRRSVEMIFDTVSPKNIAWVSLGGLRYMPSLKKVVAKRFPKTRIFTGELIPGLDGKTRYFKPIRLQMYTKMREWIRPYAPDLPIYLCMESGDLWNKTLDAALDSDQELAALLDQAAQVPSLR